MSKTKDRLEKIKRHLLQISKLPLREQSICSADLAWTVERIDDLEERLRVVSEKETRP